jgi:nucleoside-diphosphate-sugar epimerase
MKILITGHKGFIGTRLWERFSAKIKNGENITIHGIDLKTGSDILHANLPEVDLVIHLAALAGVRESVKNPKAYWQTNVEGTKRILEHYRKARVLCASSSSVHEPYLNPYAGTKYLAEQIPHGNVCHMRFHTVYNESARSGMFFDKLFDRALKYITKHERDFIHLEDMCDAIEALVNHPNVKGTFDIGTGRTIFMNDICPDLPIRNNTPGERQRTCASVEFMKSKCGWTAKRKIEDFLKEHNEIVRYYNKEQFEVC